MTEQVDFLHFKFNSHWLIICITISIVLNSLWGIRFSAGLKYLRDPLSLMQLAGEVSGLPLDSVSFTLSGEQCPTSMREMNCKEQGSALCKLRSWVAINNV